VVVLDDCHDSTPDLVARHNGVHALRSTARQVGEARRAGVDHLLRAAAVDGVDRAESWIANTDADSLVPADWLIAMLSFADAGADLVLGTVVPGRGLPLQVENDWRSRHDTGEGHRHIHGANLGIRASTYTTVGGWRRLASGEDEDLVHRVTDAGRYQIRRTGHIPVVTSTRMHGRAPHGFSSYLRALAETSVPQSHDPVPARPWPYSSARRHLGAAV
jgi:hypothetical protein